MTFLVLIPFFIAMYWLLAHGGCDYHKHENGHDPKGASRGAIW